MLNLYPHINKRCIFFFYSSIMLIQKLWSGFSIREYKLPRSFYLQIFERPSKYSVCMLTYKMFPNFLDTICVYQKLQIYMYVYTIIYILCINIYYPKFIIIIRIKSRLTQLWFYIFLIAAPLSNYVYTFGTYSNFRSKHLV